MEIIFTVILSVLVVTATAATGAAYAWYGANTLLRVMLRESVRREKRTNREKKALEEKIELLTDRLLVKSGYGRLRPAPIPFAGDSKPIIGRVTSPSEAIAREKRRESEAVTSGFIHEASQIQASAANASRNGTAGE